MEIRFQLNAADTRSILAVQSLPQRLFYRFATILIPGLAALPASVVLCLQSNFVALGIGWGIALTLAAIFFRQQRRQFATTVERFRPGKVRIGESCLEHGDDWTWSRRAWSGVKRIVTTPTHTHFVLDNLTVVVVPRRAFESSELADQFAQTANAYLMADRNPPDSHPVIAATVSQEPVSQEPVSQESGVIEVRYTNSFDDFVRAQALGINKPVPAKKISPAILLWVVFFGFAFVAFSGAPTPVPLGQALTGFLIFIAMFAVTLLALVKLLQVWGRWEHRQNIPRREQTVVVSDRGVRVHDSIHESFVQWEKFDAVEHDEQLVVVFLGKPSVGLAIPKAAVANCHIDAERLIGLIRNHIDHAQSKLHSLAPCVASDNPYQSPSAI